MLRVEDLEVSYGEVKALRGISFEAQERVITSLVGSNGAGKTTTLKAISGLLKPQRGRIIFRGIEIQNLPPHKVVELGISHIPEGRKLWPRMTVLDNLEMGAYCRRARGKKEETLKWIFQLFPRLEERKYQLAGTLSGGEQQMLAVGRGLMAAPELLMFDEPSLGLAPLLVKGLFEVIAEISREGVTILLVEQNVQHALKLSSYAYVIENGLLVLSGTGENLLDNPQVKSSYLGI